MCASMPFLPDVVGTSCATHVRHCASIRNQVSRRSMTTLLPLLCAQDGRTPLFQMLRDQPGGATQASRLAKARVLLDWLQQHDEQHGTALLRGALEHRAGAVSGCWLPAHLLIRRHSQICRAERTLARVGACARRRVWACCTRSARLGMRPCWTCCCSVGQT